MVTDKLFQAVVCIIIACLVLMLINANVKLVDARHQIRDLTADKAVLEQRVQGCLDKYQQLETFFINYHAGN